MKRLLITGLLLSLGHLRAESLPDFASMKRAAEALILGKGHQHAFVHYVEGQKGYLALEKITDLPHGKAEWKAVDAVPLPEIGQGQVLATLSCELNGKFVPEIAAIAARNQGSNPGKAAQAWRADLEKGKLNPIPAEGILCGSGE